MIGDINYDAKPQKLDLFLAKPDRTIIAKLSEAYQKNHQIKLGNINEISLSIPYDIEIGHRLKKNPNIDLIKDRYLIKAVLNGSEEWYTIRVNDDSMEEDKDVKNLTAYLLPYEMNDKLIGVYKEDGINLSTALNGGTGIDTETGQSRQIDGILNNTRWSVNYVDASFDTKYRSVELSGKTVLDAVMSVAETYQALIVWDTVNRKISFYNPDNVGNNKGFRLSYGKYLRTLGRQINSDEMATRLTVFGKDISIQKYNITGKNYLEDFSYFMYPFQFDKANRVVIESSYYMSDNLCIALTDYADFVQTKQGIFDGLLTQLQTYEQQLTTKNNELATLNTDLAIINNQLDIENSAGHDTSTIVLNKNSKLSQISSKQGEINTVQGQIDNVNTQISALRADIDMSNFVDETLALELNDYIIEKEWSNQDYVDEQDLYEEAKKQFQKIKNPQLIINVDMVNFLDIIEAQRDWNKLSLGDTIIINYEKMGIDVTAKIIEIDIDYEEGSINLVIANTKDIETDEEKLIKMLYSTSSVSTTIDMSKYKWDQITSTKSQVDSIINNTWDAIKTGITAGVNNTVSITERGILVKNTTDPLSYLIIQNSVLAITNDGGNTWKNAITKDGIVAERLFGKIIAGVNLTIDASDNTGTKLFTVDGNGVTIAGTKLTITNGIPETQINTTSVSKWNAASTTASNAWNKFSGVGNTLPAGNVEFNFAGSSSKGGNATNTDNVGGQTASTVAQSTSNFNNRNDRKGTTPATPVILSDGTAVDHTINTDGSADLSFEWTFNGTGDAYDIDGFLVYMYSSTSSSAYTFGTTTASEQVFNVTPDKRGFIVYGVPANNYYTFGVKAYRMVDNDINTNGVIYGTLAKSTANGENPYQPSTSVAFAGNITGTVNGTSASTITTAVTNFNNRNDRNGTTPANPTIVSDGTAIDHAINTDGSADISFEWGYTGTGAAYDIDGFIIYIYQTTASTAYTFGTDKANEQVFYVTPDRRAFILYGVAANKYYTFGVQAYRIVDGDIATSGLLQSSVIKSSASGENPYQPSSTVAFAGDVTGTISGSNASTVASNANNSVQKGTTYNGVVIDSTNGLVITRLDSGSPTIKTTLNATQGFLFQKNTGTSASPIWTDMLKYDSGTGNLFIDGVISAKDLKINGVSVLTSGNTKISGAYIDSITTGQITVTSALPDSAIASASTWNGKTTYLTPQGIYTGTLTANQINAIQGISLGANATIDWNYVNADPKISTAQTTANNAQTAAGNAQTTANNIASGNYIGGTFIDSKTIKSPIIKSGDFQVYDGNGVLRLRVYPTYSTNLPAYVLYGTTGVETGRFVSNYTNRCDVVGTGNSSLTLDFSGTVLNGTDVTVQTWGGDFKWGNQTVATQTWVQNNVVAKFA